MTRWGILGPGRIAHKFAQDLLTVPDAQLYAVASSDRQRAAEFAEAYSIPHAFGSYEELLTLPDLDVVYVATPHVKHHENVMMLLNGGIAVLGEKPFAMNGEQVGGMVEAARSKGVFLMEALWSRFMPGIVFALDLVKSGAIGKVVSVKADFGFKAPFLPEKRLFNKALGGGSLLDIGIYPLFLSYLILGKPTTVKASATFSSTGVDEQCGMVLTYADGQVALLDSCLLAATDCLGIIQGETGQIRIHSRFHETKGITLNREDGTSETFAFERDTHGYDYEAKHVMSCLAEGKKESPLWSLDDSLNLMQLLDAVRAEAGIVY
ncbi:MULTISPECIES: Gfo/Idh/MocA family oxidoreductase [unclassified Spirosoma]|uniref:Gfo/Idh/MocA family protein n=1 Tax=unclassified Spirosoma TaxID=2621999 RepID=UPI00095E9E86|nr:MULTISPECIES: Gfo/Idh/MocA family oxidoreductase [unclassified Spirosoma]MBN8822750.1 Gfo/Idh/MocA family oxidoreductase [Spirosoma sp.]OJW79960.1 MAG: oxidoreductase [Spirosoma sp. 48-14]